MRIQLLVCSLIVALLGAVVATPATAQGKGKGQAKGQGDAKAKASAGPTVVVNLGFAPRDREIITTYYTQRPSGLPPGLQKKLQRNGTLPPGWQKKVQPFPADLDRQLPRLPAGYLRVIVGRDVVVYQSTTQKIIDIIHDIVH